VSVQLRHIRTFIGPSGVGKLLSTNSLCDEDSLGCGDSTTVILFLIFISGEVFHRARKSDWERANDAVSFVQSEDSPREVAACFASRSFIIGQEPDEGGNIPELWP
jgi:uncharacterized membrane protein